MHSREDLLLVLVKFSAEVSAVFPLSVLSVYCYLVVSLIAAYWHEYWMIIWRCSGKVIAA